MKNCSRKDCQQFNPQEDNCFSPDKRASTGLASECKSCKKKYKYPDYQKQYYIDNIEKRNPKINERPQKDVDRIRGYDRIRSVKRSKTYEHQEYLKKYYLKTYPRYLARSAKRHAAKIQRTPKWLSKEHLKQIEAFYIEANRLTKETGIQHHVDHIIPLQGKNVSGLHVPWNLQILTREENISKGNKILPNKNKT